MHGRMKVLPKFVLLRVFVSSGILLVVACSGGRDRVPYAEGSGDVQVGENELRPSGTSGCVDGSIEQCTVKLPRHDSVDSCFQGFHECIDGRWGPCVDAEDLSPVPRLDDS